MAAAYGAAFTLGLSPWLASLYDVPISWLIAIGIVNAIYGVCSFALARRTRNGFVPMLRFVAVANMVWAVICFILVIVWRHDASIFGLAHFALEGLFVGALGVWEWRVPNPKPASGQFI